MKYFRIVLMLLYMMALTKAGWAQPNLSKVEYFIDTDPGYGLATSITVPASTTNFANQTLNIDPTSLSIGLHILYMRAQDANGVWSHTVKYVFIKSDPMVSTTPNLSKVEYFIDNDPGFGNGTQITVPPSTTNFSNQIFNIDPTSLSTGLHIVYMRAQDANGVWSHTYKYVFIKADPIVITTPNLSKVEYFIDTDPGFGNATQISVPASTTDFNNQVFNIDPTSLNDGLHIVFMRAQDANGAWSHTQKWIFVKRNTTLETQRGIKYAEYFIDTDPGFLNASPLAIAPNADIANQKIEANVTGLATGNHRLYIRALDSAGKWSHTDSLAFTVPTLIAAPSITVNSINRFTLCARDTFNIGYQATGTYNAGNVFTVQMSDAIGNFATPTIIGTKTATKLSDTIRCKLPSHIGDGTGYLLRVVSSNTAVTGIANAQTLTVRDRPFAQTIIGRTDVNGNYTWPYNIANVATSSYNWITTGGIFTPVSPTSNGSMAWAQPTGASSNESLRLIETNQYGCVGDTSLLNVVVYKLRIDNNFSNTSVCKGEVVTINYSIDGAIDAGNVYTVQLSDASGNFSSPTNIGSTSANGNGLNQTGIITATIPFSIPNGNSYRIRVISSTPSFIGANNAAAMIIQKPDIGVDLTRSICQGLNYDLSTDFTDVSLTYQYYDNAFVGISNNVSAGVYNVIGTNSYGCKDTTQVTINNYSKPNLGPDVEVYLNCLGDVTDISNTFITTSLTTVWTPTNTTNAGAGTYQLVVTNANGCKDTALAIVKVEASVWTGVVSSDWHVAGNWNINKVPTDKTHVIIPNGTTNPCVVSNANGQAASIQVKTGANISFNNGKTVDIKGKCSTLPSN